MKKVNWIILASEGRGIQYGVGTFIRNLSKGLTREKKGISVFIVEMGLFKNKYFEMREEEGINYLRIPLSEHTKAVDSRSNQEKIGKSIRRILSLYIPLADFSVVHMNFLSQFFIAKELKLEFNSYLIFTQHVFAIDGIDNSVGLRDKKYFDTEHETYQLANQIITVSHHGKEHLTTRGVSENKVQVIYNGIDQKQFDQKNSINIKKKYGLPENEHLVLFSGRIDKIKGVDYLTSAFGLFLQRNPNCRLVIAGSGNFEAIIKATCHFSSHVSLLGFVPFEDLVSLYRAASLGVIPSLEEHCSYVALKMLSCGLPVVASKIGGLKEIFIHNKNAFLSDMLPSQESLYKTIPDVDQFAKFMYKLLISYPLRREFSQNAVTRANAMFSIDIMVNKYWDIIINQIQILESESQEARIN